MLIVYLIEGLSSRLKTLKNKADARLSSAAYPCTLLASPSYTSQPSDNQAKTSSLQSLNQGAKSQISPILRFKDPIYKLPALLSEFQP